MVKTQINEVCKKYKPLKNKIIKLFNRPMYLKKIFPALLVILSGTHSLPAQDTLETLLPNEDDYYKIVKIPIPEGVVLEAGGVCTLPSGHLAVSTRRGDVWIVENPASGRPNYRKFASGLHEILGLAWHRDALYCAQRGELTKLTDRNGDGKADRYETVYAWPISGHYHEYSFGPKVTPDGAFLVTGNVSFGSYDWWSGKSIVPWRGWTMKIWEDGRMEPFAAGMRSPCSIGMAESEFFYGDNQGDWMGSGFVTHVEKGDFTGHPASLDWADRPESPVKIRKEMVYGKVPAREDTRIKPEYIRDEPYTTLYEFAQKTYPGQQVKSPAVWLPHGILGVSTSEIITDDTKGAFGPFAGQLLVGDQGMSKIARVFLEKVNGHYQGAAFDFRSGFRSGVLRMCWGRDQTLYVGGTNRGWGSTGKEPFGLERLVWTGQIPFEMKAVRAMPDGFEIEFTHPVRKTLAEQVDNYAVASFIYKYHPVYGSPVIDYKENAVRGARVSADGLRVRIVVDSLREGFVHDIQPLGIRSAQDSLPLLHPAAYYTLNHIPAGAKADFPLTEPKPQNRSAEFTDLGAAVNTPDNQMKEARPSVEGEKIKTTQENAAKTPAKPVIPKPAPAVTEKEAMALAAKHTCIACHKKNERAVGPSFADIAKRKYSVSRIVQLVHNPEPQNWPSYTPMAPMAHVPKKDIELIAKWINSLK
jgi:cytochrome c551/c552